MTLAELIAEVYVITGRPDLVSETASAIRKATLKMHSVDFWYRDLQETALTFPTESYTQQYDLSRNLSNYRALKYIREWNATPTGQELFLERVEPDAILDSYGIIGKNIWYVAGDMLNMRCQNMLSNIVIGYYRKPDITTNLYSSWIASEYPFAIIEEAAANIFQMISQSEAKQRYEGLSRENIAYLRQNYLLPEAR